MDANGRHSDYKIMPLFLQRRSSRALSGEAITYQELMTLFEAARWAPSASNNQPWRFIYGMRGSEYWATLFDLLNPSNQSWVKPAAALVVVISADFFELTQKPSRTHSFDAGAAWENLALQGTSMGLVVHAMEGFDYTKARTVLMIPESYTIEAMIAIGRPGPLEDLPRQLQEREKPSGRKQLHEMVFEGYFKNTKNLAS